MVEGGRVTAPLRWARKARRGGIPQPPDAGESESRPECVCPSRRRLLKSLHPNGHLLLSQDYSKYGVTKAEDKQRLFRAIKALNQEWKAGPSVDQWQMPGSTDDDSWQKGQVSATEVSVLLCSTLLLCSEGC